MKVWSLVLGVASVLVGILGMLAGVLADPSLVPVIGPAIGDFPRLASFLLGFLVVLSGFEIVSLRLSTYQETRKLTEAVKDLSLQSPVVLEGESAIYRHASMVVKNAKVVIRAATFRESHRADEPDYWAAMTSHMLEVKKQTGGAIDYRHVYGYADSASVQKAEEFHRAYFAALGLAPYWNPKFLANSAGVDMLIIDNDCVMIALPVLSGDSEVRRAVVLPSSDGVGRDVASWFDNYLWVKAKTELVERI